MQKKKQTKAILHSDLISRIKHQLTTPAWAEISSLHFTEIKKQNHLINSLSRNSLLVFHSDVKWNQFLHSLSSSPLPVGFKGRWHPAVDVGSQPVLHCHVPAAQTLLGHGGQLTAPDVQVVNSLKVILHFSLCIPVKYVELWLCYGLCQCMVHLLLFKWERERVCVCMCVCVHVYASLCACTHVHKYICVCVCVEERDRDRDRDREAERETGRETETERNIRKHRETEILTFCPKPWSLLAHCHICSWPLWGRQQSQLWYTYTLTTAMRNTGGYGRWWTWAPCRTVWTRRDCRKTPPSPHTAKHSKNHQMEISDWSLKFDLLVYLAGDLREPRQRNYSATVINKIVH